METINTIISNNIKAIRKERKMSLDNLAEVTGISKSMLGQIERMESNPTIAILWKIAMGLDLSFTSLVEDKRKSALLIHNKDIQPLINGDGTMRIFPVFPYEERRGSEILYIEMEKGAYSPSLPHKSGTEEYVLVYEGEIAITLETEEYLVKEESSIRYQADCPHSYKNVSKGKTKLCMIIYYKK